MPVILVRHAETVAGGAGLDDAARHLSSAGRAMARRVAQALASRKLVPSAFVTSPRMRAVQTAELFAHMLGFDGPVESMPSLCYTVAPQVAARELSAVNGLVFAFGHMPSLPEIGKLLCGGRGLAAFAPSEAWLLENGRASWSLSPDDLVFTRR